MSDYSKFTVSQLKEKLKELGLPVSGKKQDLIDRLNEHGEEKEEEDDGEDEEEEEEEKPKTAKKRKADDEDTNPAPTKKKKGVIKVDEHASGASVFEDWGVTLNQTNISQNNNKFYIVQLIQSGTSYSVFTRWGRVGENGQKSQKSFPSLVAAQKEFCKKFKEKTKNDWETIKDNHDKFKAFPQKYTLLEMEHDDDDEEEIKEALEKLDEKPTHKAKVKPCSLPKPTQELLKLVLDHDMFKEQMAKMEIDTEKLPLGKISRSQVNKGFDVLEEIEEAINNGNRSDIQSLSSRFYTVIPHAFGRRVPPPIGDLESVQKKRDMLNVLADIEIARNLTEDKKTQNSGPSEVDHPLDVNYKSLDADLEPLAQDTEEYEAIEKYLNATMGGRKLSLLDVFTLNRKTEGKRHEVHEDIANRKLLWHGTNVAVVAAIIKTGLRIMPHSGGRVGRGIYFASENSKSANYVACAGNIGIMFLNEVALGKEHWIKSDDPSLKSAPDGFDSVIAKGWTEPDPSKDIKLKIDGHDVVVPQGKPINIPEWKNSTFSQTEYLVYKESQVRMRYLLKLRFNN